jgi:hypothetical protein
MFSSDRLYHKKMTVGSAAKSYFSHAIIKPIFVSLAAAAGDHILMKNNDLKGCAVFGAVVGGSVFLASNVEQVASSFFPTATSLGMVNGVIRNLEGRVVEICAGSAGAIAFHRLVLGKQDFDMQTWAMRVGIIAASDVIGDTACTLLMIV